MQDTTRQAIPYARTAGNGPTVICLHSSTSSSKQFKPLMEQLGGTFKMIAIDLYGYGKTCDWNGQRPLTLADEAALLGPVLAAERGPVYLVGHSYGGAVALKAATMHEHRVAGLLVYEPVLFGLLKQQQSPVLDEINAVRRDITQLIGDDNRVAAAQRFVDYWSGDGAFDSLPDWQREVITGRMPKVLHDFEAVMDEPTPLSRFGQLHMPIKLMFGTRTRRPAIEVIHLLASAMPHAITCPVQDAGHMGPMTNPDRFNRAVAGFLSQITDRRTDATDRAPVDVSSGLYSSL